MVVGAEMWNSVMQLKRLLRSVPLLVLAWRTVHHAWLRHRRLEDVFRQKYFSRSAAWSRGGVSESLSGKGSDLGETEAIRGKLVELLAELKVASLVDVGCGDFHWMSTVDLGGISYLGLDVVPEVIERNKKNFGNKCVDFRACDATREPIPPAYMIVCRDVLVHLPLNLAVQLVDQCRASGARYLLATTFVDSDSNEDVPPGHWHPINLSLEPFNLGKSVRSVVERHSFSDRGDKALCLWDLRQSDGSELSH